jgi:Glycosyl transferase family 2
MPGPRLPHQPRGAVRDEPNSDLVAEMAHRAFMDEYGRGPGAAIAVIIPAFNESESVASVVRSVPARICGLDTEVILIDDGSTDGTGDQARTAGALVSQLCVNLGQGRAFRLGYQLARDRGATYIATSDADGQFDAGELPSLIAPLLAGDADFVNGSRRLGRAEPTDPVRKLGIVVFGALITALTGVRITDPANGLRAFRSEVSAEVPLRQPQYQSSELLIGAIAHGFRVLEAPVTVYARAAGTTKKGGNFSDGLRFARVVITTWWTERPAARRRRGGPLARPSLRA